MNLKTIFEYHIPMQTENYCRKMNSLIYEISNDGSFDPFYPTEIHVQHLVEKIIKSIESVKNENGGYNGDSIRVKIEIEYEPESK